MSDTPDGTFPGLRVYSQNIYKKRDWTKPVYNIPKVFRPIMLLNTLGKLIEKTIANRLQWEGAHYNLLHPCQFRGLKQKSTKDAGVYLTHLVHAGWAKGLKTSVVAFDLAQYFPSLNHSAVTLILDHMGFADSLVNFIADYLVGRSTSFLRDHKLSDPFPCDVGVGQGSALSPIISGLYLSPMLWAFHTERIDSTLISYIDDGTIIVQSKLWTDNLSKLKRAYKTVFKLTSVMGLILEHNKSEAFHFSRIDGDANPLVDLGYAPFTGSTPLIPKCLWRYLGLFFDCKLLFRDHARLYVTKAFTATLSML